MKLLEGFGNILYKETTTVALEVPEGKKSLLT